MSGFELFAIWFGIITGVIGVAAAIHQYGWKKILQAIALLLIITVCCMILWQMNIGTRVESPQQAEMRMTREAIEKQNTNLPPQPVLTEEQKKAIKWKGHDLQLPLVTDGQWILDGWPVEAGLQPGQFGAFSDEGVWKIRLAKIPKTSPSIILRFSTGNQTVEYNPPAIP